MLKKLGKMLVVAFAAVSMLFCVAPVKAAPVEFGPSGYYKHSVTQTVKYFATGHPLAHSQWHYVVPQPNGNGNGNGNGDECDDYFASSASGGTLIGGRDWNRNNPTFGGGISLDVNGVSEAVATGEKLFGFIPGFAYAWTNMTMTPSIRVIARTNSPKRFGLARTYVKSIATLGFSGEALATGLWGVKVSRRCFVDCEQYTGISISGDLTAHAYGNAKSVGPYGTLESPQAWTGGIGSTTASFEASTSDTGGFLSYSELDGMVKVTQDLFVSAFVSRDGTLTRTYGEINGGSAYTPGCDNDANLTGISSEGTVEQASFATNGAGAMAFGSSQASYSGATGYVGHNSASASGTKAVVTGFNSVVQNGNSLTITSTHSAYSGPSFGGIK